ncbi:MAG TPA: anti-sigma factor [Pyrinomonadaceae bacterium]|nr:anti-sigma factor [Pyrinomonadaceae bacterium]
MDCKVFRERLDLYVDGELSGEELAGASEHLRGCASCAKAEAGLRHLRSSLKRVVNRHLPPPALEAETLRSIRSRKSVRAGRVIDEGHRDRTPVWRARVVMPAPLFAVLVLAVVALAGWLLFARDGVPARRTVQPGEASAESYFSGYYGGERASIKVVPRASLESSRQ